MSFFLLSFQFLPLTILGGREMGFWVTQKILLMHQVQSTLDQTSLPFTVVLQGRLGVSCGEVGGKGASVYFDLPLFRKSQRMDEDTLGPITSGQMTTPKRPSDLQLESNTIDFPNLTSTRLFIAGSTCPIQSFNWSLFLIELIFIQRRKFSPIHRTDFFRIPGASRTLKAASR